MTVQFQFDDYMIPVEDSPSPGGAGEWNLSEKLIEQDPLNAGVTVLTSWGFRSRRRTISGKCGQTTRDTMRTKHLAKTVGNFIDGESRSVRCRIIASVFTTKSTAGTPIYAYSITFLER